MRLRGRFDVRSVTAAWRDLAVGPRANRRWTTTVDDWRTSFWFADHTRSIGKTTARYRRGIRLKLPRTGLPDRKSAARRRRCKVVSGRTQSRFRLSDIVSFAVTTFGKPPIESVGISTDDVVSCLHPAYFIRVGGADIAARATVIGENTTRSPDVSRSATLAIGRLHPRPTAWR